MNTKLKMNLRDIGKRLKAARNALDLSIEKIAQATGFSKGLISEAENGRKKPSSVYLFGLLDQFHVNVNYILTGEGQMFLGRHSPGWDSTENDDEIDEMIYMIENVNLVKYAVLKFFIEYKTQKKEIIKELLEKEQKKDQ